MLRTTTLLYTLLTVLTLGVAGARPSRLLSKTGYSSCFSATPTTLHTYGQPARVLGQGTQPALNVYPNPARGQATLQVSGATGADCQVRLSNVLGSEVRRFALRPDLQAAEGITLDLSGVPPGLYFCSLLSGEKTLATKRLTVL